MINLVVLRGRTTRPVTERLLPSGDRLAVIDLTVLAEEGPGESVPLAWFDPPTWVAALDVGAELVVVGRVRRRFFRAGGALQSRTEVVVGQAAPARRAARVSELLRRAAELLDSASGDG
jgi:single-strand DNA-binding protein